MALPRIVRRALKPAYLAYVEAQERLALYRQDVQRATFYRQFIKPGDVVFDVGANTGNRTRPFLRLGARVIAFEPQANLAAALREQFAKSNVVVVDKAVGRQKTGLLRRADASTISSMSDEWINAVQESGRFVGHEWGEPETVPMTSLDDAVAEHGLPAFLKVDVEGYEFEVLGSLSSAVASLSLEFTVERLSPIKNCISHLATLGSYEFRVTHGEELAFAMPSWSDAAGALQCIDEMGPAAGGDIYARLT